MAIDRTVVIHAGREVVFRFFTDSERWARWWGRGSSIEPQVGGAAVIVYPGGVRVTGVVTQVVFGSRLAFTYNGSSLVTIEVADAVDGATRLTLKHELDEAARAALEQGWTHQLALLATAAAADIDWQPAIDAWFAAWGDAELWGVTDDVRFRDAHADVRGIDQLREHLLAVATYMPGVTLEPRGRVRRSHDTALVDWTAVRGGETVMSGTNVFRFAPDGRIVDVVGVG